MMQVKAYFVAPSLHEATYWAELWGYRRPEWRFINDMRSMHGFINHGSPTFTAFICGSSEPDHWDEIIERMEAHGITVMDAQSIDVPGNPERETEWIR
jgi:hypothetical protein